MSYTRSYHEGHNDPVNLQLVAQTEWTARRLEIDIKRQVDSTFDPQHIL